MGMAFATKNTYRNEAIFRVDGFPPKPPASPGAATFVFGPQERRMIPMLLAQNTLASGMTGTRYSAWDPKSNRATRNRQTHVMLTAGFHAKNAETNPASALKTIISPPADPQGTRTARRRPQPPTLHAARSHKIHAQIAATNPADPSNNKPPGHSGERPLAEQKNLRRLARFVQFARIRCNTTRLVGQRQMCCNGGL